MPRELGEYLDAHLEIEKYARKSGPILESAVQMLIADHAPLFRQSGAVLRHQRTDETMEDFMKRRRKEVPNDYADWVPDDPAQLLHVYTDEAFGEQCCPKTVTRLYTFMNDPIRFAALAKEWGCDTARMIPGKRPGSDDDGAAKKKTGENNPFNPANQSYGSDAVRQNEIAKYIRAFGAVAAARSAAKYSVDLAGRPLGRT